MAAHRERPPAHRLRGGAPRRRAACGARGGRDPRSRARLRIPQHRRRGPPQADPRGHRRRRRPRRLRGGTAAAPASSRIRVRRCCRASRRPREPLRPRRRGDRRHARLRRPRRRRRPRRLGGRALREPALLPEHRHGERPPPSRAPRPTPSASPTSATGRRRRFADLDGDGDVDAAVGGLDGHTFFFRNTGTAAAPAFASRSTNAFGLADVGGADAGPRGPRRRRRPRRNRGRRSGPVLLREHGQRSDPAFAAASPVPSASATSRATVSARHSQTSTRTGIPTRSSPSSPGRDTTIAYENSARRARRPSRSRATASASRLPRASRPLAAKRRGSRRPRRDGDLDALLGSFSEPVRFLRNGGSASLPAFASDPPNPFGLAGERPLLADLDADGDLDVFVGRPRATRTSSRTRGAASQRPSPRGDESLRPRRRGGLRRPEFADIDGDGDLDAFVGTILGSTRFFQNTGTAAAPAFAAAISNPFGLAGSNFMAAPDLRGHRRRRRPRRPLGEFPWNLVSSRTPARRLRPAFAAPRHDPFGFVDSAPTPPPSADIDDDGDLDAFVGRGQYLTVSS